MKDIDIDSFNKNGFVILDNGFAVDEIERFRCELKQTIRSYLNRADLGSKITEGDEFQAGIDLLENTDHKYVADIYDTVAYLPSFLRLAASSNISDAVRTLLGKKAQAPLYSYIHRCLITHPGDATRNRGWHQEVFYTIPQTNYLQTWAPLVNDASEATGTVCVSVGSHQGGIAPQTWVEDGKSPYRILIDPNEIEKYPQQIIEMKVGQVLIFSGFLFHKTVASAAGRVRYTFIGMDHYGESSHFTPPRVDFQFSGKTPREYFDECAPLTSYHRTGPQN